MTEACQLTLGRSPTSPQRPARGQRLCGGVAAWRLSRFQPAYSESFKIHTLKTSFTSLFVSFDSVWARRPSAACVSQCFINAHRWRLRSIVDYPVCVTVTFNASRWSFCSKRQEALPKYSEVFSINRNRVGDLFVGHSGWTTCELSDHRE